MNVTPPEFQVTKIYINELIIKSLLFYTKAMFNYQFIYEGSMITLDQYLYFRARTILFCGVGINSLFF